MNGIHFIESDKMKPLIIRPAVEHDIPAIRLIGETTYRDHFAALWTPDGMARFLNADFATDALRMTLGAPDKHLWLLGYDKDSHEPVGFAKVNWSVPDPINGQRGAELQKIYFAKTCVGKGYGNELLSHIIGCAKEHAQQRLWLDVLKNNTGAQHFYERNGFRRQGDIPFKTDLYDLGMVVMAMSVL